MSETLRLTVRAVERAEEAVRSADIVAVSANAQEPVLRADWLEPGMHISHIQSRGGSRRFLDARMCSLKGVRERRTWTSFRLPFGRK